MAREGKVVVPVPKKSKEGTTTTIKTQKGNISYKSVKPYYETAEGKKALANYEKFKRKTAGRV